ncbi:hypothetical protein Ocin01_18463 [Orchesella cincta]|uniref:Uncharacterized protein n=1 Tax=Orchesella cincta TaxID=48709 RepID=A0A1D2M5G0_ORCCI|nr:hypothetical protein Ocin01_18463 [Orchesella cincta]
MSPHKFVASLDGTLSFIGIPIGTYFLYVDTWWCNVIGYWSAVVVGVVLTTMMLTASIQLYSSTNRGTDLEEARYMVAYYVAASGAFESAVLLAAILFAYPLLWTNIYLWVVLIVGLLIRIPSLFKGVFDIEEVVEVSSPEPVLPQPIIVVNSTPPAAIVQTFNIQQGAGAVQTVQM